MCIPIMASTVKLQKIGNSIRATIPKEVVDSLSLRHGQDMIVLTVDDSVVFKKRNRAVDDKPSKFYGILKERRGRIKYWPSAAEIKRIWE